MRILIFGHSGSGKSTLAEPFSKLINGVWINADQVRTKYNDWDFSLAGRRRQAYRMASIAYGVELAGKIAIIDMVCPTQEFRDIIAADYTVWMDTIEESEFEDTNEMFELPATEAVNYHVSKWFADTHKQLLEVVQSYIRTTE